MDKKYLSLLFVLLLSACNQTDLSELKKEINKEKKSTVSFLPAALEIEDFEIVSYTSAGLKSPFRNTISEVKNSKKTLTDIKPDLNRVKGELESYPLTNFQMLGTIKSKSDQSLSAIVNNGAGKVFIIDVGTYIGQNNGKILKISPNQIEIEEIVANGNYRWVKRPVAILMLKK